MSQFDDPEGAMPPPDDEPESTGGPAEEVSPQEPAEVDGESADAAPDPLAPVLTTPVSLREPDETLDRRVVVYWILSGLISWLFLSSLLAVAAAFVYAQTDGDDGAGWRQAWGIVLPIAVGLSGLLLAWTVVSPPWAFARWRFSVDSELLLARYGIFFIEEKAIPISRLQHVDLYRGFVERMFGLTTLIVFTAGTEGAHFRLPGLAHQRARDLRDQILAARGDDVL